MTSNTIAASHIHELLSGTLPLVSSSADWEPQPNQLLEIRMNCCTVQDSMSCQIQQQDQKDCHWQRYTDPATEFTAHNERRTPAVDSQSQPQALHCVTDVVVSMKFISVWQSRHIHSLTIIWAFHLKSGPHDMSNFVNCGSFKCVDR